MLIDYGSIAVESKSGKPVTVRNDGTVALALGTVTLVGVNRDQLAVVPVSNPRDGRTLATGQRCTVAVGFKPTTAGLEFAQLRIPSNDPHEAVVKMSRNGTATSNAIALPM